MSKIRSRSSAERSKGSDQEPTQQKLDRLKRMQGMSFRLADYCAPSAEWDHDHCEGCWETFAEFDAPEILHSGYFTAFKPRTKTAEEPQFIKSARKSGLKVMAKPDSKIWVCGSCFEELRKGLKWHVKSGK